MSLDAGGLAQMTYNHNTFGNGIGMPRTGFASRGRANSVKRLSVAPPSQISTIDENHPAPRTSRSHLLAGLRTAPKSPSYPTSAPPTQLDHRIGLEGSRFAGNDTSYQQQQLQQQQQSQQQQQRGTPKTATGSNFMNNGQNQFRMNGLNQFYSPDQILAPPAIQIGDDLDSQMDPNLYEELLRTNQYLAQQQMRLQQQLINVTAAAQQFQNMNLGQSSQYGQQLPMTPGLGFYNHQLQNGVQPIVEPVPNQPGLYTVYNPLSGQVNYFFDQNAQQSQPQYEQPRGSFSNLELSHSPPPPTPTFRAQVSPPPPESSAPPVNHWRSASPPKISPSPPQDEATPLPPPSANAFRANNRKSLTLPSGFGNSATMEGLKSANLKAAGFPQTPVTGTFGPGQAREGEHPLRQPRGPPSLEELVAKPTTKFEGSKNFATRQRRRAVNNLVRAGMERRTASRGAGSIDSVESLTPASETEITFSISSDNDSDSGRSGSASLSGKPSLGSLRAVATGAIGSERKELKERSRERQSVDSYTATSVSSEEGAAIGGKLVEVRVESPTADSENRPASLRKSSVY